MEINDSIFIIFKPNINNFIYTYYYDDSKTILLKKDSLLKKLLSEEFGKISSAVFVNKDSIIFFQERKISIFSEIKNEIVFEYFHSHPDTSKIDLTDRNHAFLWDNKRKALVMQIIRFDNIENRKSISDVECIGELSVLTQKTKCLTNKISG